jgi:transposase-like protein
LTDTGTQNKREDPVEAKRKHIIYKEEFRRQAVEMVIHSGKTQAQVARELGCSEYSLNLWKKAYFETTGAGRNRWAAKNSGANVRRDPPPAEGKRVSQMPA